jgi:hypothetical protein
VTDGEYRDMMTAFGEAMFAIVQAGMERFGSEGCP